MEIHGNPPPNGSAACPDEGNSAAICSSCKEVIPASRPQLRCLTCLDYTSCADCRVMECFVGAHRAEHGYEVYRHGQRLILPSQAAPPSNESEEAFPKAPLQTASTEAGTNAAETQINTDSEPYWGMLISPTNSPSAIFSRLIAAIFSHFAAESADVLQPSEFCALMAAAGYQPAEFPPLQTSTDESASPADLHHLDAWLAEWYQSFPLDHRMATREFPAPPPVQPHNGRIRMRDQLMHAMMYPPASVIPDGLPLLSQRGLEVYLVSQAARDPSDLAARVSNILRAVPALMDRETGRPFESNVIPEACFPVTSDPSQMTFQVDSRAAQQRIALQEESLGLQWIAWSMQRSKFL